MFQMNRTSKSSFSLSIDLCICLFCVFSSLYDLYMFYTDVHIHKHSFDFTWDLIFKSHLSSFFQNYGKEWCLAAWFCHNLWKTHSVWFMGMMYLYTSCMQLPYWRQYPFNSRTILSASFKGTIYLAVWFFQKSW